MQTNTLGLVPAKPLTPEQKADAARLKQAWEQWQQDEDAVGRPYSQAEAAFKLGFGQSAMSQYLRGYIPLNAKTLAKFCLLIGARASDISPTIVEEERRRAMAWYELPGETPDAPNVTHLPKPKIGDGGKGLVRNVKQKRRRSPPSKKTGGAK